MSRWQQLNYLTDELAKNKCRTLASYQNQITPQTTIFPFEIGFYIDNKLQSRVHNKVTYRLLTKHITRVKWIKLRKLSPEQINLIDWDALSESVKEMRHPY